MMFLMSIRGNPLNFSAVKSRPLIHVVVIRIHDSDAKHSLIVFNGKNNLPDLHLITKVLNVGHFC